MTRARAARFAGGRCAVCPASVLIDRQQQPWARARTCSESCRAKLGNRGRNSSNCTHCDVVESYRLTRDSDIRAIEVAAGDERPPITYRDFLTGYRYEREAA